MVKMTAIRVFMWELGPDIIFKKMKMHPEIKGIRSINGSDSETKN